MTIKQALISVSDKTGVIELARELTSRKIGIISSGGTAKVLTKNRILCTEISEITGFPEILDGRVKTLNPKIHGGILARRDKPEHLNELEKHSINTIDIVIVNLYPFENTLSRIGDISKSDKGKGVIPEEIIENIDIGGVALLRAAAKNFKDVLVISDPSDYALLIEQLKSGSISQDFRRDLASKAFRHTAYYDSLISGYLTSEQYPQLLSLPLKRISSLRYGENPHQEAAVYALGGYSGKSDVVSAKQLQGKELSYNNYLDIDSSWKLIKEFEAPACAIIKHSNPCGCAEGKDIVDAYKKAISCDSVSAFGGIIAVNRLIDEDLAVEIVKVFTECIIAPGFSKKALKVFATKKNLRLLEQPSLEASMVSGRELEFRSICGGILAQNTDTTLLTDRKIITIKKPSESEIESLLFAWKVCKHTKSNAIILVKGKQTVGVGAGQMSRIDSLKIASEKMKAVQYDFSDDQNIVLASDAFFPFPDVVNESSKIGVTSIIQPGGSIKDEDSIKAANDHNIAMIFTSMRHFRH